MLDYILFRVKYRRGNFPVEQTVIEILDRGNRRENRDAAEELGRKYLLTQQTGDREARYIGVEPFVAVSERPTPEEPTDERVSSIYEATAKKQEAAKVLQPLKV